MNSTRRWTLWIAAIVYAVTIAVWFASFPVKSKFNNMDLLGEGSYLLIATLAYWFVLRLQINILVIGWPVFTYGLLLDFLDEFTLDKEFLNDPLEDLFNAFGLILVAVGFYLSYLRRTDEVGEIRESSARLELERSRLAVTLGSIEDGVITVDADGRIQVLNDAAAKILDVAPAHCVDRELAEVFRVQCGAADQQELLANALAGRSRSHHEAECTLQRHDGNKLLLELSVASLPVSDGATPGAIFAFSDVTQRRRLEREVMRASKLESVGLLAGGVAHDFNNILTGIMNWASLARSAQVQDPSVDPHEKIRAACVRGKALSTQLLGLARGGAPIKAPTSLAELVRTEAEFVLRGSSLVCQFAIPEGLWMTDADAGQLGQVIQNIVLNAKQAMANGGVVDIELANAELGQESGLPLEPGRYVCMRIRDHGPGISAADAERIFEPYFTTKESGSGLGLATAYAVVRRHGGHISVAPADGGGCVFTVYLAASSRRPEIDAPPRNAAAAPDAAVLLVDDDASIREPLALALGADGYQVATASSGEEAVELYAAAARRGAPYEVVVMDLTMPGDVGGAAAMRSILELDPCAVGIVASGYHDDPVMADHEAHGFRGVISKPFDSEQLTRVIEATLRRHQAHR